MLHLVVLTELSLLCRTISCPTIPQKGHPSQMQTSFLSTAFNGDSLLWLSSCRADVARCSYTWKWSQSLWSLSPGPFTLHWAELCAGQLEECVRRERSDVCAFGDWKIKCILPLHFYSFQHCLVCSYQMLKCLCQQMWKTNKQWDLDVLFNAAQRWHECIYTAFAL